MATVLYIEASPRGDASVSSQIASEFIDAYLEAHPNDTIDHLNVFIDELPPFAAEGAKKKMQQISSLMTTGKGIEAEGVWALVLAEVERLKRADKVIISSAMWNFSIPYPLKHYIDIVCQPGLTFGVDAKGEYFGLVKGKPMQLILASGSEYAMRFPEEADGIKTDFQRAYLYHFARFIGFEDVRCIKVQPTAAPPKVLDALMQDKRQEAREAAQTF